MSNEQERDAREHLLRVHSEERRQLAPSPPPPPAMKYDGERDGEYDSLANSMAGHEALPDAAPQHAVHINVYDLRMPQDPDAITRWNSWLYWGGLGLFHSGVQVHDKEYAFGGHMYDTTGIFTTAPRDAPEAVFRSSHFMGYTSVDEDTLAGMIDALNETYKGISYNLLRRNCNHFADELCFLLTGRHAPAWINRMAWLGTQVQCVLPEGFDNPVAAITPSAAEEADNLHAADSLQHVYSADRTRYMS
ncbi:DeSI-like protein [Porphyridium purpureum]|uniref:DeSI-like protein n=1 Tax=Porphyridium purpureum TaxID=35688 RepID=A0A5J4Z2M6_PORPP|nr:DeSI-like protein [Porphyridium purpureum]|eukprot:POR2799..scf295_1